MKKGSHIVNSPRNESLQFVAKYYRTVKPADKTYEQLIDAMKSYMDSKQIAIYR